MPLRRFPVRVNMTQVFCVGKGEVHCQWLALRASGRDRV